MLKKLLPHGLAVMLILAVVLAGCGGGKSSRTPSADLRIYVGGHYYNSVTKDYTACYWDADGRHDLDNKGRVVWLSFYNNQLYVVGCYNSGAKTVPCYWNNTGRHDLVKSGSVSDNVDVYCGFVYNGQVYAGGYYYDGTNYIPCYWDSTGQHNLPVEEDGEVYSIFVNSDGVYAGGRTKGVTNWTTCYWDNDGIQQDSFDSESSLAKVTQIVVDNNRIYMSGENSTGACYWVIDGGTVKTYPLGGEKANSIFVSNNQVYVGGCHSDSPCYWDDAGRHSLDNPDNDYAYVNSIFVYNNKVYAAGHYVVAGGEYYACYWDGTGRKHNLDVGDSDDSCANCILAR